MRRGEIKQPTSSPTATHLGVDEVVDGRVQGVAHERVGEVDHSYRVEPQKGHVIGMTNGLLATAVLHGRGPVEGGLGV